MMNPQEFANIAKSEANFWWYRGMRRIMFGLLDPIASARRFGRVLETGSGTGHFSSELHRRYGWNMVPLDLGWEGLVYGRGLGVPNQVQGNILALPFGNGTFDALISMDVIVHLPRGEEMPCFQEIARVLRPGGFVAIRVSALDILRSHHSAFAMERQRFTKSRLLASVQAVGLRPLRCSYANSLLLPVAFTKFRIIEPLLGGEPTSGVQPVAPWLDTLLYQPLAMEAKLLTSGLNLPLGQSLILLAEKA